MNFENIVPYLWMFRDGLLVTLQLTVISAVLGFLIAAVLVWMSLSRFRVLHAIASVYITVVRALPMLLQLFIVYFAVPQIFGRMLNMDSMTAAVIALSFNGAAYYAEVMRGGILSVDSGQKEAAKALGVSRGQTMAYIVFPQAGKKILPSMLSEFVLLFKETALVAQIGVADLFYVSGTVSKNTYSTFEAYILVAIIYYAIVMLMTFASSRLEQRLRLSD